MNKEIISHSQIKFIDWASSFLVQRKAQKKQLQPSQLAGVINPDRAINKNQVLN